MLLSLQQLPRMGERRYCRFAAMHPSHLLNPFFRCQEFRRDRCAIAVLISFQPENAGQQNVQSVADE